MTTENIKSATVIIELDSGEYAATSTTNRAFIDISASLLEFKHIPKDMVSQYNIKTGEFENE